MKVEDISPACVGFLANVACLALFPFVWNMKALRPVGIALGTSPVTQIFFFVGFLHSILASLASYHAVSPPKAKFRSLLSLVFAIISVSVLLTNGAMNANNAIRASQAAGATRYVLDAVGRMVPESVTPPHIPGMHKVKDFFVGEKHGSTSAMEETALYGPTMDPYSQYWTLKLVGLIPMMFSLLFGCKDFEQLPDTDVMKKTFQSLHSITMLGHLIFAVMPFYFLLNPDALMGWIGDTWMLVSNVFFSTLFASDAYFFYRLYQTEHPAKNLAPSSEASQPQTRS
jgi:hypothetical protein